MTIKDTLSFLEINYATEKQLVIPSIWVRLIHLGCQAVVFGYIIWLLIYQDGYQIVKTGEGFTQTKVKATSYYEGNNTIEVWDAVDLVIPEKESSALFITTSFIFTQNQTRSICYESDTTKFPCPCEQYQQTEHGIAVGPQACNTTLNECEIYSWCPLEKDEDPKILKGTKDITVLIRNYVKFSSFNLERDTFYDNQAIPQKNLFTLEEIVENAHFKLDGLVAKGAVIGMIIKWRCNADVAAHKCKPEFQYQRLDNPNSTFSSGFNFRYARYHQDSDSSPILRDQYKVNGIRITFLTDGRAKKFNIVKLIISLGTGLGILSFAGFLSDAISMWLLPLSPYFRNKKYMNVDEEKKQERRMKWKHFLDPELLNKAYF